MQVRKVSVIMIFMGTLLRAIIGPRIPGQIIHITYVLLLYTHPGLRVYHTHFIYHGKYPIIYNIYHGKYSCIIFLHFRE